MQESAKVIEKLKYFMLYIQPSSFLKMFQVFVRQMSTLQNGMIVRCSIVKASYFFRFDDKLVAFSSFVCIRPK